MTTPQDGEAGVLTAEDQAHVDAALDDSRIDLLAEVFRRCLGIDENDNTRHDFGDLNGGGLQRPSEVAAEFLRALNDEGLTVAARSAALVSRDDGLDEERLAKAIPKGLFLADADESKRRRRELARAIAAEYRRLARQQESSDER